jgi:hypothetical protein
MSFRPGSYPGGRRRHSQLRPAQLPAATGHRQPDALSLFRHGGRQHPLRGAATERRAVERIARQIGGGDWLETLPDGLQTDVGERGARLSMGQRQLVVLARMLAQDPAIFILDEATASVDPFTEAQIQTALRPDLPQPHLDRDCAPAFDGEARADRIIVLRPRAHHRSGQPRRADGAGRALRRAVRHLLPPSIPGLHREPPRRLSPRRVDAGNLTYSPTC